MFELWHDVHASPSASSVVLPFSRSSSRGEVWRDAVPEEKAR